MWSAAYGLIAVAVVAFVILYAAAHAPSLAPANAADEVYRAKLQIKQSLPGLPRVERPEDLADNTIYVARTLLSAGNASFPVHVPLAYVLDGGYRIAASVLECRDWVLPSGEPAALYRIALYHHVIMPWLEVYAAIPANETDFYLKLYEAYRKSGRPPLLGFDRAGSGLVRVRAEHALIYNASSGLYTLYVIAPRRTVYIVIVDYPLELPLSCP
jgi:hypothetical protein